MLVIRANQFDSLWCRILFLFPLKLEHPVPWRSWTAANALRPCQSKKAEDRVFFEIVDVYSNEMV
ncbi:MAG TPA: hypothetical protein DDZ51_08340 [Planctomycetaceae bacterium]|nr:hypothetical protein [Planctomycetaceae bacterium]